MIKRKFKIGFALIFSLFVIAVYFLSEEILLKYNMHKDAIFAGINDLILSDDINEYISHNQELIDIIHYDLDINLFPEDNRINGKAILTGVLSDPYTKTINLNLYDNLKIHKLKLNGLSISYQQNGSSLILSSDFSSVDTFKIVVEYEGIPRNIGLSSFSMQLKDSNYVVYTLNEPTYASTWFPCNDKPDDKAYLDIKITNHNKYSSVSNGKLISETVSGERKTFHWQTQYPISTYLISINSAIYEKIEDSYISENDTMDIFYYVFPEDKKYAQRDFAETPKMIKVFSEMFGEYPFIKEKYGIIEFLWQSGAMEHQTITGIGSYFVSGYNLHRDILIHELAHHWWGNAVGPKSWKDIWLNEGFATYSEALYFEAVSGQSALRSTMINNKDFPNERLYAPEGSIFSSTVYDKGAWILHMLRKEIGDDYFFKVLRNYFEKFKYKNASTLDFKNLCEELSNKNLDKFFKQWVLEGEDRIELYTKLISEEKKGKMVNKLRIVQEQSGVFHFPIDIDVVSNRSGKTRRFTFNINSKDTVIVLDYDKSIKNYRVDPDHWLLADFLKE